MPTLSAVLRPGSLAALVLLAACASPPATPPAGSSGPLPPLTPDLTARAPTLSGFGVATLVASAAKPEAQRLFAQGVVQAYAFDEQEAVRQFKAALAADPSCALCAWGVAWQLGPNINSPRRGDYTEARRYAELAQRLAQPANAATPRERGLIDAMTLRYGGMAVAPASELPTVAAICRGSPPAGSTGKANPQDVAYADVVQALAAAFPDDPDVLSLWAEAALIATAQAWWSERGEPAPRVGPVVAELERQLPLHPQHTGIAHYLIHATDAPAAAYRGVPAADRLAALAPQSPHLLHMPSHTYARIGRYAEASAVNQAALAADETLASTVKAQGFSTSTDWRGHNGHFLWYALLMEGRGDESLAQARRMAQTAARSSHPWGEYARSLPALTLLRLERWQALVDEPPATGNSGLADALAHHARGVAQVRLKQADAAAQSLAKAQAALTQVRGLQARKDTGIGPEFKQRMEGMALAVVSRLQAEVAAAAGRADEAYAAQREALRAARPLDLAEPPMLAAGMQLALAEMELRLGDAKRAENSFRADLAAQPESGWALAGIARALDAQRHAAAADTRVHLAKVWPKADAALLAPTR
jgi:hypothetical protein